MAGAPHNFKLLIEYDGTGFCGWQRQDRAPGRAKPAQPTVQACLEKALSQLCREPITLYGSGRTDSGVHARGQVASFHTLSPRTALDMVRGGNALLPFTVAILAAEEAPLDFHARFSAKAKIYSYEFSVSPTRSALLANRAWWVGDRLDWAAINEALAHFIGEKDFAALRTKGTVLKSTTRNIMRAEIEDHTQLKRLIIKGDGFMRHMVRAICGTLVMVGKGQLSPDAVLKIIKDGQREKAGPNAPPQGLYLEQVIY